MTARPSDKINLVSASIDGVAAILQHMVQSEDHEASRMAYACGDMLERISEELGELALSVRKLEPQA